MTKPNVPCNSSTDDHDNTRLLDEQTVASILVKDLPTNISKSYVSSEEDEVARILVEDLFVLRVSSTLVDEKVETVGTALAEDKNQVPLVKETSNIIPPRRSLRIAAKTAANVITNFRTPMPSKKKNGTRKKWRGLNSRIGQKTFRYLKIVDLRSIDAYFS